MARLSDHLGGVAALFTKRDSATAVIGLRCDIQVYDIALGEDYSYPVCEVPSARINGTIRLAARYAPKLEGLLPADSMTLSLMSGGEHRLSQPEDLGLQVKAVAAMAEQAG